MFSIIGYHRKIIFATIIVVLLIFSGQVVVAQSQSLTHTKKEFEETFQTMLSDPANIEITMKYANLAVKLGDYESAIPALERILLFNPSLSKIKQQLGVLYFRLESYDMAQNYLEDAINSKGVSTQTIQKAKEFLEKIKQKQRQ